MRIHTPLSRTAGALLLCSACHDDGLGEHGCPLDYSSGWGSYGLNVEHEEPTRCPVFITEPGATVQTGATVVDGGVRNFTDNRLLLVDANGSPITVKNTVFGYDESGRWVSVSYVFYAAGRADLRPDDAYYDLTFNGGAPGPTAHMSISYTDAVSASINGPGIVQQSGTYTWSASVATGVPPYTYRWYRNWTLAATGSSYTARAGGDTILLRLDVRDARGEVDSYSRRVLVNQCSDGARVC